ncbi:MAG: Holliday junction resolvase RuvX [Actinomycetota bacterium]
MSGRIIGLDPGERRIGVAIADPTGTIASPDRFIDRKTDDPVDAIAALCRELGVTTIVIGLPVALDGREGPSAKAARVFGEMLARETGITVEYHDERFTSATAEQALISGGMQRKKRKEKRDQVAAAVMLQGYLDARRYDDRPGNDEPSHG